MGKIKGRKRKLARTVTPPSSILQVMPRGRIRMDPTVVPDVATWLVAFTARWYSALNAPHTEESAAERAQRHKRDSHSRAAISAVNEVMEKLVETQDRQTIEDARDYIQKVLTAISERKASLIVASGVVDRQ